jgi:chemotaxis protein histidine kinase CheA
MNQEMGLTEFFAMEAGEYLERLDTLVSGAVGPDRDEFVRLSRALRGSALMANQQHIGGVAAALEGVARAVKEERVEWDEATRQITIRAIDGLKILVRSVSNWGDSESNRASQLANDLATISGVPISEPTEPREPSVDTGTRAFVAREGATVASVLDQTAKAVQRDGPTENQIETVLRSMEPLRGLAALSELSPLPEFLDGVERALAVAAHGFNKPNDLALFLDVAARGLSKATQEISTSGAGEPESVEAHEFTRRLAGLLDMEGEIAPIQSLYYEDNGPHVLEAGSQTAPTSRMGQMEFVAHGEHLCQVSDGLEKAEGETQRDIRLISLKTTLRTLTAARGSSLAAAVSAFAYVALEAITAGYHDTHKAAFISRLRAAGKTLGNVAPANEGAQLAGLAEITEALRNLPEAVEALPVQPVAVADGPISRPMAPSAAVPVASDVPTTQAEPSADVVFEPAEAEVPDGVNDLAVVWNAYEDLRRKYGDGEPSIDDLISGRPVEEEFLSITELCYSGPAALQEAHSVRERIRGQLAESGWDAAVISELFDELLDLVELGVGQT